MILVVPEVSGPHDPQEPAPPPPLGSVRRTSTIDTRRHDGLLGPAELDARGRDLMCDTAGNRRVVAHARVRAALDGFAHHLDEITAEPPTPGLEPLLGAVVGPGFRARVDRAVPDLVGSGDLRYLLLDDLPGATLVSGYALLHADVLTGVPDGHDDHLDEFVEARADLCAGWARDASMLSLIAEHRRNPVPVGPVAPPLGTGGDLDDFHPVTELGPFGMRRLRRLDLRAPVEGASAGTAFFRDTHVTADGVESIVHEYTVSFTVDVATRTLASISARPDVLPWMECPRAAESAGRLTGLPLAGLRLHVRREFTGTSTCTHLHDVLRSLADVGHLLDLLERSERSDRPAHSARPDADVRGGRG
ncbi:MAG: DUF2889 domain-containing protein [Actinomycetes bacterium]